DGLADARDLVDARLASWRDGLLQVDRAAQAARKVAWAASARAVQSAARYGTDQAWNAVRASGRAAPWAAERERVAICDLIRDIVGNPSRRVEVASAWRTPDVVALATAAYEDRLLPGGELDPGRLPVLADAVE